MADILALNSHISAPASAPEFDLHASVYQHHHLPLASGDRWIRVFKIQPHERFSAPIECKLQQVCLDKAPPYDTISYTWGNPLMQCPIYIDGKNIDYSHCIKIADMLVEGRSKICQEGGTSIAILLTHQEFINYGLPHLSSPDLRRWLEIFTLPWFKRMWTVQEVSISQAVNVIVPSNMSFQKIPWDRLMNGLEAALYMDYFTPLGIDPYHAVLIQTCTSRVQRPRKYRMPTRLLPVLMASRRCDATCHEDKVYALVAFMRLHSLISIDYGPCMTVQNVYRDTAIAIMQQDKNLGLLGVMRSKEPKYPDLPSWVPDWSCSAAHGPTLQGIEFEAPIDGVAWTDRCAASGATSFYTPVLDRENRCLLVSGFVMATVEMVHTMGFEWAIDVDLVSRAPSEGIQQLSEKLNHLESLYNAFGFDKRAKGKVYIPTGESFHDAFWQTMLAGYTKVDNRTSDRNSFNVFVERCTRQKKFLTALGIAEQFKPMMGTMAVGIWRLAKKLANWDEDEIIKLCSFEWQVPKLHRDRILIKLSSGMIGAAPGLAQPGDRVALIKGANVPIILRGRDNGEWEVIGEAYVHGLMNGEEWVESKAKDMLLC